MKLLRILVSFSLGAFAFLVAKRQALQQKRHRPLQDGEDMWDSRGKNNSCYRVVPTPASYPGDGLTMEVLCLPHATGAVPGKSCSPPYHRHAAQNETFQALKGAFSFQVEGSPPLTIQPGDAPVMVLAGTAHTFWNEQPDQEGVLLQTFDPAHNMEGFFRNMMGLAQTWGSVEKIPIAQLMSTVNAVGMSIADVPRPIWGMISKVLPLIESALGISPFYSEYSQIEAHD